MHTIKISGKGVHMYKGVGVHYADIISYLKYPMNLKLFGLTETKLFNIYRIFKIGV